MCRVIRVADIVGAAGEYASEYLRGPVENWDGMSDSDLSASLTSVMADQYVEPVVVGDSPIDGYTSVKSRTTLSNTPDMSRMKMLLKGNKRK